MNKSLAIHLTWPDASWLFTCYIHITVKGWWGQNTTFGGHSDDKQNCANKRLQLMNGVYEILELAGDKQLNISGGKPLEWTTWTIWAILIIEKQLSFQSLAVVIFTLSTQEMALLKLWFYFNFVSKHSFLLLNLGTLSCNLNNGSQIGSNFFQDFLMWNQSWYFREGDACRVGSSKCLGKVDT